MLQRNKQECILDLTLPQRRSTKNIPEKLKTKPLLISSSKNQIDEKISRNYWELEKQIKWVLMKCFCKKGFERLQVLSSVDIKP